MRAFAIAVHLIQGTFHLLFALLLLLLIIQVPVYMAPSQKGTHWPLLPKSIPSLPQLFFTPISFLLLQHISKIPYLIGNTSLFH